MGGSCFAVLGLTYAACGAANRGIAWAGLSGRVVMALVGSALDG